MYCIYYVCCMWMISTWSNRLCKHCTNIACFTTFSLWARYVLIIHLTALSRQWSSGEGRGSLLIAHSMTLQLWPQGLWCCRSVGSLTSWFSSTSPSYYRLTHYKKRWCCWCRSLVIHVFKLSTWDVYLIPELQSFQKDWFLLELKSFLQK